MDGDDLIYQVARRCLAAIQQCKRGEMTREELRALFYKEAGVIEQWQWEDLEEWRTEFPEGRMRELMSVLADLVEADLRKGAGHA